MTTSYSLLITHHSQIMTLEPNTTISHYRLLSEIGKGGMGVVYLAQDTKLDRKVAIKFLPVESSRDKEKLQRFVQEAKSASALNHPGILTIYEIGEAEGSTYIATEYINGTDIGSYIRERKISLEKALDIAIQIVKALKAAHDSGIVHRDIKPENVMIREDGIIKILDFGLAKLLQKIPDDRAPARSTPDSETMIAESPGGPKTSPGMVMGTVNYMSPEQARGRDVDQRADIFSFGALFYEMLTRRRAFDGESTSDVIAAVLMKEPVPISELNDDIPERLQEIVGRCVRKDRNERFRNSAELLDELTRLRKHLQIEEIEKTILPAEDRKETMMFPATTAGGDGVITDAVDNDRDSIVIRRSSVGKIAAIAALVIILGITSLLAWNYLFGDDEKIGSVAVMPFVNESGDPEVEYLSDGLTEDLISSLTEIPDLSVKARSTVFYYKGKNISPKQVGTELGVDAVLLGRVVQRGEALKLNLELVNTATLDAIWSKSYDRNINALVDLQSEIARDVSERLRSRLTTEEQQEVAKTNTASSEAQQLYLKGRFYWNKRNIKDFERAEEYFTKAIEADPGYAQAYSGLADTYTLKPYYGNFRPKDFFPKARQAAQKALELDPELAEAYASIGQLSAFEYDFAAAERAYKKAIELNPKYAGARQWYSETLMYMGRLEEAQKQIDTALELEPLSMIINHAKGYFLESADRLDEAIAQGEKTVELFPNFAMAHGNLFRQYAAKRNFEKAAEHGIRELELLGLGPEQIERVKAAHGRDGWKGLLNARLELELSSRNKILEEDSSAFAIASYIAWAYAVLGDKENTLKYLNISYEQREPQMVDIGTDVSFDFLKGDPEFEALKRKIGLPE